MSNSSRPHGLQPTRLLHPWDFPGKSTGVGCHRLLCFFFWDPTVRMLVHLILSQRSLRLPSVLLILFYDRVVRRYHMFFIHSSVTGDLGCFNGLETAAANTGVHGSFCIMVFSGYMRRQWHATPVLLPGKSHGRRSLVGCSPRGR